MQLHRVVHRVARFIIIQMAKNFFALICPGIKTAGPIDKITCIVLPPEDIERAMETNVDKIG